MGMNSVERYYQKKKKRKKRARVLFFSLLFILLMITLAILSMTVFFNAETIIVEGNNHYSAEEILERGGLKIGQNLFRLDKFKAIEQMQELPYIKSVTIRRRLPNRLTVEIVENQPVVWVATEGGAALLNEDYRVLEFLEIPAEELPAQSSEEQSSEEQNTEGVPAPALLEGIPQLTQIEPTELLIGETAKFGEEDYTGFLKRLYEAFLRNTDLEWPQVKEIQFFARYDVKLLYGQAIIIDFGTLDQADTKLELAAYLLKDNGSSQPATLDVSNTERVYYRPRK